MVNGSRYSGRSGLPRGSSDSLWRMLKKEKESRLYTDLRRVKKNIHSFDMGQSVLIRYSVLLELADWNSFKYKDAVDRKCPEFTVQSGLIISFCNVQHCGVTSATCCLRNISIKHR